MIDIETTEAFLKVFDYLSEKFGIVVDATNKDVLPYLQTLGDKIVNYEKSIALMWIVVGTISAILGLVLFFIGCAKNWDGWNWLLLTIFTGIGVIIIIFNMYTYIGCVTFEEKIILEYIEDVISTTSNSNTR